MSALYLHLFFYVFLLAKNARAPRVSANITIGGAHQRDDDPLLNHFPKFWDLKGEACTNGVDSWPDVRVCDGTWSCPSYAQVFVDTTDLVEGDRLAESVCTKVYQLSYTWEPRRKAYVTVQSKNVQALGKERSGIYLDYELCVSISSHFCHEIVNVLSIGEPTSIEGEVLDAKLEDYKGEASNCPAFDEDPEARIVSTAETPVWTENDVLAKPPPCGEHFLLTSRKAEIKVKISTYSGEGEGSGRWALRIDQHTCMDLCFDWVACAEDIPFDCVIRVESYDATVTSTTSTRPFTLSTFTIPEFTIPEFTIPTTPTPPPEPKHWLPVMIAPTAMTACVGARSRCRIPVVEGSPCGARQAPCPAVFGGSPDVFPYWDCGSIWKVFILDVDEPVYIQAVAFLPMTASGYFQIAHWVWETLCPFVTADGLGCLKTPPPPTPQSAHLIPSGCACSCHNVRVFRGFFGEGISDQECQEECPSSCVECAAMPSSTPYEDVFGHGQPVS